MRLASSDEDILAAQRLRYRVFVEELGADGDLVDHAARLEKDRFDPFFDHLILFDETWAGDRIDAAIGVYRLMPDDRAAAAGRFYSEDEYDLTPLKQSGRRLLELGRSCVDLRVRGSTAMFQLWSGLADYVLSREIEVLFGVASFHGTDVEALAPALSYLHHNHLAPPELRVRAREAQRMDLIPPDDLNRREAIVATPALIKGYLRLGGFVGEGAYIDRAFNTTDVCLVVDTENMSARHKSYYVKGFKG